MEAKGVLAVITGGGQQADCFPDAPGSEVARSAMGRNRMVIYYVEDDANIRNLTVYALEQAGFEGYGFPHAADFFEACKMQLPDLILLDIMLPDVDGMEILSRLRADSATKQVPVMMLTAKGTEFDAVSGLNAGADDYLSKPFGMMEMVARVNALLRRFSEDGDRKADDLSCGALLLRDDSREVFVAGKEVVLTLKEFDLLKALLQAKGTVLSREQLLGEVWGLEFVGVGETRTVDVHIQTLRQKISKVVPGTERCIQTVRGIGYCAKEPEGA